MLIRSKKSKKIVLKKYFIIIFAPNYFNMKARNLSKVITFYHLYRLIRFRMLCTWYNISPIARKKLRSRIIKNGVL